MSPTDLPFADDKTSGLRNRQQATATGARGALEQGRRSGSLGTPQTAVAAQRGGASGSPSARRHSHGTARCSSGREPRCTGTASGAIPLARSAITKRKV